MISKHEFDSTAREVRQDLSVALPAMIKYKSFLQREVLNEATQAELEDVRDGRISQTMINKLARLAKQEWKLRGDANSLYCVAMAVATIIKEYGWGLDYLVGDGLWRMADRIQNS